jgi:hypothetical protein
MAPAARMRTMPMTMYWMKPRWKRRDLDKLMEAGDAHIYASSSLLTRKTGFYAGVLEEVIEKLIHLRITSLCWNRKGGMGMERFPVSSFRHRF